MFNIYCFLVWNEYAYKNSLLHRTGGEGNLGSGGSSEHFQYFILMISLYSWKRDIISYFIPRMRRLEKLTAMTKPRHLWFQGSRMGTPSPLPHPPYLWLSHFRSSNGCSCGNVLSHHSLSWPMWLKYSCLFINCAYSEKSTNWRTRRDYN